MFKVRQPYQGVLHLVFDTQKDLAFSMFRLEEFYEGPYEEVKGKFFSIEEFIELYTDSDGVLDYFEGWDGFNVPRWSVDKFEELFTPQGLTRREKEILATVKQYDAQYLIATTKTTVKSTVDHELAHARWATDEQYKQRCMQALKHMPAEASKLFVEHLLEGGYPADPLIMLDEHHAYIKTASKRYLRAVFKPLGTITVQAVLGVQQMLLEAE